MKQILLLLVPLLGLFLSACQSRGPTFDARAQPGPAYTYEQMVALTNVADIEEQAFTNFTRAQGLTAEMLEPAKDLYRLGPGDAIEIDVMGDPAGRALVTVGPDGRIYYSLLPGTFVWGLTLTETKDLLEKGLKKYVRVAPDVSVNLRQANSKTVWVLGNVAAPGVYSLAMPMTLLEVITTAGGTLGGPGSPDGVCDLQRSFVMRDGKLLPVDFDRLLRSGDLSQNIHLRPNDFVYLRSGVTRSVYVMGAVAMPGAVPYQDKLSLMGAILSCGGTVPYAQVGQVAIVRGSLAQPRIALVDFKLIRQGLAPDVRLQPGDIVNVAFVPWRKLAIMAESMLDSFVLTTAANGGYYLVYPNASPSGPIVPVGPPPTIVVPPVNPPPVGR